VLALLWCDGELQRSQSPAASVSAFLRVPTEAARFSFLPGLPPCISASAARSRESVGSPGGPDSDPRWEHTDSLLFKGSRIKALQAARDDFDLSVREAIENVGQRFSYLADHDPASFQVPLAGYWEGLHT
jgi:hypothetical protein